MSLNDFEILSKLGEGAYSTVLLVKRKSDSKHYAIKEVRMNKLKEKEKQNSLNEVRILASVKHPNIISYKQAFFENNSLYLVMEYADNKDLYERILEYQKKGSYMSESFIWNLLIQLTKGLKALHDLKILHRDLKSANVFLTSGGLIKLGDMNVSKVAKQGLLHTQTGTPYYASPEVWKDIPYNSKSDIWSLGCVLYEAICLKPPFRAEDMNGLYRKVIVGDYPRLPRSFSKELHRTISKFLQVDPKNRPSCSEILKMPSVVRHIAPHSCEDTNNDLLKTIYFPTKGSIDSGWLPQPNYLEENRNNSEPSPKVEKVGRQERQYYSVKRRDYSEPTSIYRPPNEKKSFLKETYGALKLPRLKYPLYRRDNRISPKYLAVKKYLSDKRKPNLDIS